MNEYIELSKIKLSETSFIQNPINGSTLNLNIIQEFIFKAIKENKTQKTIVKFMVESFKIEKHKAQIYYEDFAALLLMYRII